jgi:hypothetical protein
MVEKTLGFMFFLKHGRKVENTEMYIYLRITVDGRSNELSTKRLWDPGRWNARLGRATGNGEGAKNINTYLDTLLQEAHKARKVLMDNDRDITATATFLIEHYPGCSVHVLGEGCLLKSLQNAGIEIVDEKPDLVVLGGAHEFSLNKVNVAIEMIIEGARFIATNRDPSPRRSIR